MDGTYDGTLHLRLPRADTVVLFETQRLRCLWRVTYRWLARRPRPELPAGCPDRVTWEFARYIWTFDNQVRPKILNSMRPHDGQIRMIRLTDLAHAKCWLAAIPTREA